MLDALGEFYGDSEAEQWMESPHRLLGQKSPRSCIRSGRTNEVWALIDQLRTGAFI